MHLEPGSMQMSFTVFIAAAIVLVAIVAGLVTLLTRKAH